MYKKDKMNISIIIPTYNRRNLLEKCLSSLLSQSYPKNKYEIIVVNDGSKDDTEKYIKNLQHKYKNVKYVKHLKNKGVAAARNTGIKNSKGKYLIFLDDDCTLEKDFIKNLRLIIKDNPSLYVIEASFLDPYKDNYYNKLWYLNYLYHISKSKRYKKEGRYVKFLGNCYIIKKILFKKIGYFDEKFRTREDTDLIIRMYNKNIPIILFYKLKIKHYSRSSFSSVLKQFYKYKKYEELLFNKWGYKLNKIFDYYDNLNFLSYTQNKHPDINIAKIKYALVARYFGSQLAIMQNLLKTFKMYKFLKTFISTVFHIKNIYAK